MKIKPLLLSLGIAAVFALSCVPGAVAYNTCANGVVVTHFYHLFHSGDVTAFVSGILPGVSLLLVCGICSVRIAAAPLPAGYFWFWRLSATCLDG